MTTKKITVGLAGNPNCGKTTLFNAFTGAQQRVGNWPGVTVDRKSGYFTQGETQVEVVDLPGTYSLTVVSESSSIDERIACEFIVNRSADVIVNILDASHLERNLYLTLQLIEMRVPMIVVLNMMDVVHQRKMQIVVDVLEKQLGCPVVVLEAHKNKGVAALKEKIIQIAETPLSNAVMIPYPRPIIEAIKQIICALYASRTQKLPAARDWLAVRLLENDVYAQDLVAQDVLAQVKTQQAYVQQELGEDVDILLADARYQFIRAIMGQCVVKSDQPVKTMTTRIDNIVLHRFLGIPIFLVMMYGMFLFAINIGGIFQDFFDIGSDTLFVEGIARMLQAWHAPVWLTALMANGIGKGINTTVTFIPVIGALFLFLAFLEDSGYMARAAFVVDRLMRALGLPGKSFVPMIIGFGCNVPAVLATRTLDNKRDRILTIMMTPFMSCGARLAIYAVFTAAFFPVGGQNVVFALYIVGIVMAMLTGLLLRKTLLQGDPAPLVMELPPYHMPRFKSLVLHAWQRLSSFLFRAGKLIVPICILIGFLNTFNVDGTLNTGAGDVHSVLSMLGQWLTPLFAPMGIHQDNWPATVGLMTGVLAKEVVVGTLNALYSQVGHFALQANALGFWGGLHDAVMSIPANISQLSHALGNPVLAKAPIHKLSQHVYGLMYQRFDGQIGAIAYLLFVLLYFPCVSTTGAMLRELNRAWAVFSVVWTTAIAYCVAVLFYQTATFARHSLSSLLWIGGIVLGLSAVLFGIKLSSRYMTPPLQSIQEGQR